ncbi:peptidase S8/S53 subtilisin kexin sedolisin, partial [Paenarthrobacter sp. NPDC089714]
MPQTPAKAATDTSAPVLVSSTVTPKTFNLSTGPATVKVTLRITDATATTAPTLSLDHATTSQSHGFGSMTLISGTTKDGTWERTMTIPQGSALGQWKVTLFPLRDSLGNSGSFQTLTTLTLSGAPSDTSAPVLVSSTVTPKTFNLSTGPATVKVTLRITDATATTAPTLSLDHATTSQSQGFGSMTLISGTTKDGTWERTMTIPQGSALGQWKVTLFPLRDSLGNSGSFQTLTTLNVNSALASRTPTITGTAKAGYVLTAN